jgi:hypothetical protein
MAFVKLIIFTLSEIWLEVIHLALKAESPATSVFQFNISEIQ